MGEFALWEILVLVPIILLTVIVFSLSIERRERVSAWFKNLPCSIAYRERTLSEPPLFGERRRPKRFPSKDAPEWVLEPLFAGQRMPMRVLLVIIWTVFVTLPYMLYFAFKNYYLLMLGINDYLRQQAGRRDGDLRAETMLRHMDSGRRSASGGRKGGSSELKRNAVIDRDQELLTEARKLLASGKMFRDLAGIFAHKYGNFPGYPASTTQYRNILKPLKDEFGLARTELEKSENKGA